MTNNDVLRRVRYILELNDNQMIAIFAHSDYTITRAEVSDLLKSDTDPDFQDCNDKLLATFLNGLITEKRGAKDGPKPVAESKLNNNIIFMKLRIAFDLKSDDIMQLMELTEFTMSKHELSAFFRKPDHLLRQFIKGLQIKLRGTGLD